MPDREEWTFGTEYYEKTEDGKREVIYGEMHYATSEEEGKRKRNWYLANHPAWVPARAFNPHVSELKHRRIRAAEEKKTA